ncbi:MAG: 30S ribosomal protein S2, partial [Candidatus Oxydemutatoraceae bacterium WSBS_2016_MAG_OTU14]
HNKIHIIDLDQTLPMLREALAFIKTLSKNKKRILFVGTKRWAQEGIVEEATRCDMPYISQRWLGGTFTNFKTVRQSIQRYCNLLEEYKKNDFAHLAKKQRLKQVKEFDKLRRVMDGVKDMTRVPDAIFVIDVRYENIAIKEAIKLGIPVIAVVDSNNSLEGIDYPIPGNDDSMSAIKFYASAVADAILAGAAEQSDEIDFAQVKEKDAKKQEVQSGDKLKVTTKKSGRVIKQTILDVPEPKKSNALRGKKKAQDKKDAPKVDEKEITQDKKDAPKVDETKIAQDKKATQDSDKPIAVEEQQLRKPPQADGATEAKPASTDEQQLSKPLQADGATEAKTEPASVEPAKTES